jgi:hypothetical protein
MGEVSQAINCSKFHIDRSKGVGHVGHSMNVSIGNRNRPCNCAGAARDEAKDLQVSNLNFCLLLKVS